MGEAPLRKGPLRGAACAALAALLLAAAATPGCADKAGGEGEEKPRPTAEELTAETLPLDIDTASYYELFTWCRSLGIEATGGRKDLQARLRSHYRLQAAAPEDAPGGKTDGGKTEGKQGRKITVKSARTSRYLTEEETEETYVLLTGDVHVEVKDDKSQSNHIILAESLTYNMTRNMVTARGQVVYTLDKGSSKEVFRGESLTFNLDTWEGVFYEGETSQNRKVNGKDVEFHFRGDVTSRLADDTVILEDGSFTSCEDAEDPHWSMDASSIWLLAPGEWALTNGVLKVGRVPLLYLPAFFLPGDEILFNPTVGFTARKGAHLQTTTYLLGRKKSEDSSLSFLKLTETSDGEYEQVPWGIFLRKVAGSTAKKADSSYWKLMLDAYSHLGIYAGTAGEFPPWEAFTAGIAFSRSIYTETIAGAAAYTPLFTAADGTVSSHWNSTNLFGVSLPFRFGLKNDLKLNGDFYGLTSHFEFYSDPSFNTDFYDRSEGIDWGDLLGDSAATTLGQNTSFTWDLSGRLNLPGTVKIPLITSLSLQYLNMKLSWLSRVDGTVGPTTTVNGVSSVNPEYYAPGRYFFYPVLLTTPSASVTFGGELLQFTTSKKEAVKQEQPPAPAFPGKGPRPPEGVPAALEEPAAQEGKKDQAAPQRKKDQAIPSEEAASTATLSYQVQPTAIVENTFDYAGWTKQSKVDFKALYTTAQISATSSLKARLSLLGGILDASGNMSLDGTARTRFNRSSTVTDASWNALLKNDIAQNKYDVKTVVSASLKPLKFLPDWSASNLSYNLAWRLYRWQQDSNLTAVSFSGTGPLWDATTVTAHSLQASVQTRILDQPGSLSLSAQLPPLSPSLYTGTLDLTAWNFKTRLSTSLKCLNDVWTWQPLTASGTFTPVKDVSLAEEMQFNLEDREISRSASTLKLWGFTAVLLMRMMLPTDAYGDTDAGSGSAKFLLPYSFSANYALATDALYFWRNRIKLQPSVRAGWTINPMAYTDNSFTFSSSMTLSIHRFLDLSFTSYSTNTKTYRYIPGLAEYVGEQWVNPLVDLAQSFNFFSEADRRASAFKIRSLSVSAVHSLHDWNLSLTYTGDWETRTENSKKVYYWAPTFTIKLQWIPVQEIKSTISGDKDGVRLRG